ncbi:MAG TPA: methyltransferase domain-containing protein [Myxococcaceae bacterium]|jgi:SAM-dependent methyltransferase
MTQVPAAERAALSHGQSDPRLHQWVASLLERAGAGSGTLVDVGCGGGALAPVVLGRFERYVGCDLVSYGGFPRDGATFVQADLDRPPYPLEAGSAQAVVSVETIEHLENPRAFVRELARLVAPAGVVVVTTPNQLSLLSKLTLLTKNQFNAFQEAPGLYPAHLTALLEVDLRRIAREAGLVEVEIHYSGFGRIPFTARAWPRALGGRPFSDNVALLARRPRS